MGDSDSGNNCLRTKQTMVDVSPRDLKITANNNAALPLPGFEGFTNATMADYGFHSFREVKHNGIWKHLKSIHCSVPAF